MMWRKLFCYLLLSWAFAASAAGIPISDADTYAPLADHVEVFEDRGALLGIADVLERGNFVRHSPVPQPGFTSSAIWLRMELVNASALPLARWLALRSTRPGDAAFFIRQEGDGLPVRVETLHSSLPGQAFATSAGVPLQLPPTGRQIVYIRIASQVPIRIDPVLWEPDAFLSNESNRRLVDGLLLGGLAIMALGGVLFACMIRERAFVLNALATITYFLGEANAKGYSSLYFQPDAPDWSTLCLPLFALVGVGLNILFVRELLATRTSFPKADRLLLVLLGAQWLPAIGILFGDFRLWAGVSLALNFPATVVLLLFGAYAMSRGVHAARYYTAAYAVLASGSLLHMLNLTGNLALGQAGDYALPIAMLLTNALLMASVVDRVMQAKEEKEAAQEALLAAHVFHEDHLNQEVQARTAELKEANAKLQESQLFAQAVLDSVASQIAVVDAEGTIIAINEAWRQFSSDSGSRSSRLAPSSGVGTNYLEICGCQATPQEDLATGVAEGIEAVIDGRLPVFSLEYDCHSPQEQRWFMMTVTPLNSVGKGAVVVHTDITERKLLENEIHHLAFYDPLTNLLNRRLLQDRLQLASAASRRSGKFSALLVLDLDTFKSLNDTHGHAVGDLLLIEVGRRLTNCVRATDTVARLGGDEFVVVIGELSSDRSKAQHKAEEVAKKILARLSEIYLLPLRQDGKEKGMVEHRCSASIGAALFIAYSEDDEILNLADAAMYQAKAAGRGCLRFAGSVATGPDRASPAENLLAT